MYNCKKLSKALEGLNTIESIKRKLNVKRATAIKYIHLLRKKGLVETKVGSKKIHLYNIKRIPIINIGNPGFYEILNKNSSIKINPPYEHRVIGRKISIEETIAWAASTDNIRIHIAVLALFNKVINWSELYKWAKIYGVRRKVGALYDIARTILKTRRMDLRIRKKLLSVKNEDKYLIHNIKAKDFKEIEKTWKIYIPFNRKDLERYKE